MQAVLWPTPAQGVQLRAVGMQAGHAGGMQVGRAVANTGAGGAAACSRHAVGMQAVLWPTPAQRVQLRAVGMQSARRRHAGSMQVGRAVANAGAGGAVGMQSACRRCSGQRWRRGCSCGGRHAVGMQVGHAGGAAAVVGMQSACRQGMQAACRWGALCVAERGSGMQAAGKRHAGPGPAKIERILKADVWLETGTTSASNAQAESIKRPGPAKIVTQTSPKFG